MHTPDPDVKESADEFQLKMNPYLNPPNKVFTFPLDWDFNKCMAWCFARNYNAFVLGSTEEGACKFTCAYSWRIDYHNQFGKWPEEKDDVE